MKFDKDAYALTFIKYKRHSTDFGWFVVGVKEKKLIEEWIVQSVYTHFDIIMTTFFYPERKFVHLK